MKINVSQLLKASIGDKRDYQLDETVDVAGSACIVEGEVRLMRTNRSILAEGTLHTEVEIACSRCLSVYQCPLSLNIEEEFFPTTDVISGAPLPLPDEPGAFSIDDQHILDLTEAIRQYTIMAIPMKPLCFEGCAGLCPYCGHNLNQGPCNCPSEEVDPRWFKLSQIVREQKGIE